jgi:hypothetical protein
VFLKTSPLIIALLLLFSAGARAVRAQGQQPSAPPPTSSSSSSSAPAATTGQQAASTQTAASTEESDLSITANVTARELRFDVVPEPKVEFTGKPERRTSWEAERQNLPRPVQPGVTYRDIGIQLKITSVFADIDRIVAEALGEVPATSDDAPQPAQPAPASSPQQDTTPTPNAPPPTTRPQSEGKP